MKSYLLSRNFYRHKSDDFKLQQESHVGRIKISKTKNTQAGEII